MFFFVVIYVSEKKQGTNLLMTCSRGAQRKMPDAMEDLEDYLVHENQGASITGGPLAQ